MNQILCHIDTVKLIIITCSAAYYTYIQVNRSIGIMLELIVPYTKILI